MSLFESIGDALSELTVVVGDTTFENVFTTIGGAIGDGWEVVGSIADTLTEDVTIDLNDW